MGNSKNLMPNTEMLKKELPEEVFVLMESLAKNVHNTWMQGRINDGWKWGEKRDDKLKLHPCIIPYEELSEVEKDYDRRTAQETLCFIINQGYEIRKVGK